MGLLSKLGLLVAFLITVGYIVMLSGVTPSIKPRKTPAPDGFVATSFQSLPDFQSNEHFTVTQLNRDGDAFHPGLMIDQGVLYISVSTGSYDSFYLFIGPNGEEIGRKEKRLTSFPIGNIIIDAEGHYTVTSTSVGETLPYADVNGDQLIDFDALTKLHDQSTYFRSISYRDFPRESAAYNDKINTYVFQINGVWSRAKATQVDGKFLDWKTAPFPEFTVQYNFHPEGVTPTRNTSYGGGSFYGDKYTLNRTWFDQQEYFRRRAASIGSTTGQGRPEHWRGTGYYTVYANGNSIGYSVPNDMLNLSGSGRITMRAMGHDSLDFIMIERYLGNKPHYTVISTKD